MERVNAAGVRWQRFFIALVPPQVIQSEANAVRQVFADRFNSRKAFNSPPHVTLQPPFRWPLAEIDRLLQAVAAFADEQPPFSVQLQGFGAFPPRVIYIDVVKTPALDRLKADLSSHLAEQLGIHASDPDRPFCPHMTVAFRDLTRSAFRQAWPEFEQRSYQAAFTADKLTLLIFKQQWVIHSEYPCGQATDSGPS
ncbi:MAG: 2'-5' RNA ligase family protein [Cyanobacteria bacterium J06648_16]